MERKEIRQKRKEFRRKLTLGYRIDLVLNQATRSGKVEPLEAHEINSEIIHTPGCPCCSGVYYRKGDEYKTKVVPSIGYAPFGMSNNFVSVQTGRIKEVAECKDCGAERNKIYTQDGILIEEVSDPGAQLRRKYRAQLSN